jgi:hypothetical protein
LYGCETWYLILNEDHSILERVAEENIWTLEGGSNMIKLHYEELHNLYYSSYITRVVKSKKRE